MKNEEGLQPLPNDKITFFRLLFDLQICSVYKNIKNPLKNFGWGGALLEVGCGSQPYRFLMNNKVTYEAIEWEGAKESFLYACQDVTYYDGNRFPVVGKKYDMVFNTEVLEHVEDTKLFFSECARVLKPEGVLLFTVPFQARYHYIPYDYWRFTPSGLNKLLNEANFNNIEIIERGTDITVAAYKTLAIMYRWVLSKNIFKIMLAFLLSPLWVCALIAGQVSLHFNIGSTDDTLGYVVKASKSGLANDQ